MKNSYENRLLALLLVTAILGGFIWYKYFEINTEQKKQEQAELVYLEKIKNSLSVLPLEAKAVAVYDFTSNKKIFGKNDEIVMPLASLTKVVSIPLAAKIQQDTIKISASSIGAPGDDKLMPGDIWDTRELGKFALVVSSNDATQALTENLSNFVAEMNARVRRFGAINTLFFNTTGLDIAGTPGAFGTASEMNQIAYYSLINDPELFKATRELVFETKSNNLSYLASNTNIVVGELQNILLSKTGYTASAQGNLTIIFKNKQNHDIAVTILGSGYETRFTDMVKIVEVLYNLEYVI